MFDMFDASLQVTIGRHVYLILAFHKRAIYISNSLRSNPIMRMFIQHLSNQDKQMMRIGARKLCHHDEIDFIVVNFEVVVEHLHGVNEGADVE